MKKEKLLREIIGSELLIISGGESSWNCKCWCQSANGFVFPMGWAGGREDCANLCFLQAYSDFWSCDYPKKKKNDWIASQKMLTTTKKYQILYFREPLWSSISVIELF